MSETEDRPPIRATQEMRDIIDDPIRFAWVTRDYYDIKRAAETLGKSDRATLAKLARKLMGE